MPAYTKRGKKNNLCFSSKNNFTLFPPSPSFIYTTKEVHMQPIIPLELAMLIDIPSMCFVGVSTIIPSAVTRGITRAQLLEGIRRIALPAGVLGTLIGFMMMLMNMSDPSAFVPAFRIAMLTSWYGVVVYAITSWLLRKTDDYQLSGVVQPSILGSLFSLREVWSFCSRI